MLLFDGVCGFCNRAVRTVLRFDPRGSLRFAALDGDFARTIVARHPAIARVDSMVFVDEPGRPGERIAVRSDAALRVLDYLGGPWKAALTAARSGRRVPCATGSTTGSPVFATPASSVSTTPARSRRRKCAPASSKL